MSAVETLGKYEIRRQLGRGAMGTVFEGFDPVIERIVAIKTVRLPQAGDDETAEEIARFRREAQAAGRLIHPNIVGVFDYGETADLAYIVMEFVDGPSLKNLLDKNERFPLPTILRLMDDLLAGLQFSHDRGVVHRDIKPANLMLTKSGQAKIADFGIARIESSSMTQAGTVLGTPAYMSPEQFMGQVVDARTDIYSSGVLLYQLLTGERPFEGSMSAIMHKALNTEAPLPSQISVTAPRPFDEIVKRAMAKRPEDRYASAAEFLASIRHAMAVAANPPVQPDAPDGEATMVVTPRGAGRMSDAPAATGAAADFRGSDEARDAAHRPPRGAVGSARSPALPVTVGAGVIGLVVAGGLGYYLLVGRSATPPVAPEPSAPSAATAPSVAQPQMPLPTVARPPVATAPLTPMPPLTSAPAEPPPPVTAPRQAAPPVALTSPPPSAARSGAPSGSPPEGVVANPPSAGTPAPPPGAPQGTPQGAKQGTSQGIPLEPRQGTSSQGTSPQGTSEGTAEGTSRGTSRGTSPGASPGASIGVSPANPSAPATPPPRADATVMRGEVAAFVSRLPCSMFGGDIRDGTVEVTGIGGRTAVESLRQKLAAIGLANPAPAWRAVQVDTVFCPWQDLLRPIAATFGDQGGDPGGTLTLRLADDPPWLRQDEYIRPRLTMAEFRGQLRVDYLDRLGNVEHLYPQLPDPPKHLAGDAPRVFAPHEAVELGDPGPANPGWQVAEPFGTDVIIALASEDALFDRPRPSNVEKAAAYLRDLRRAVEAARSRGARIMATAIPVETRRK